MRQNRGETRRSALGATICLLLAVITWTGCGSGAVDALDTSTEIGAINTTLSMLSDAATSPSLAQEIFTKEALPKPADMKKFGKYAAYMAKEAEIDGDNAKLKVDIYDMQGQVVATQDWTATRAGGNWRVSSAPLP